MNVNSHIRQLFKWVEWSNPSSSVWYGECQLAPGRCLLAPECCASGDEVNLLSRSDWSSCLDPTTVCPNWLVWIRTTVQKWMERCADPSRCYKRRVLVHSSSVRFELPIKVIDMVVYPFLD
jgi:hypothetical protein